MLIFATELSLTLPVPDGPRFSKAETLGQCSVTSVRRPFRPFRQFLPFLRNISNKSYTTSPHVKTNATYFFMLTNVLTAKLLQDTRNLRIQFKVK